MSTTKIMVVVGSLRRESVNGVVAQAALESVRDLAGVDAEVFDLAPVPFYNGDLEDAGLPEVVTAMHEAVAEASGLLIFSPEYNGSFPAVTKNAIDWLSRPPRSWEGTALSMVATSPGPRAGAGVRGHFEAIMEHQPVRVFPSFGIGGYGDKITNGVLTDAQTAAELAEFVAGFAEFCASEVDAS